MVVLMVVAVVLSLLFLVVLVVLLMYQYFSIRVCTNIRFDRPSTQPWLGVSHVSLLNMPVPAPGVNAHCHHQSELDHCQNYTYSLSDTLRLEEGEV